MKQEDLTMLHFSVGLWIRNYLLLWQEHSALLAAIVEADADAGAVDASATILQAFW